MTLRYPRTLCSIQVNNPGAGGSGTTQTDGVTIQGDGSAGNKIAIKQVETAARLTGAGTVASPLDIVGWPVAGYLYPANDSGNLAFAANQTRVMAFQLGYALTFSNIGVKVAVLDAGHNYDFGIYDAAGTLVAHIGAQTLPATGNLGFAVVGAPITITPGLYMFAMTGAATTAALGYDSGISITLFSNQSYSATSGGALNGSVTALTPTPGLNAIAFSLY